MTPCLFVQVSACILSLEDLVAATPFCIASPPIPSRDTTCLHFVRITSTYVQKLSGTYALCRYWQCLPGTPSPPPPEVAAGTYLSGKTALFPDSEGGLTGFTPLDPVLPSQNWTVTGTGVIIWQTPPPPACPSQC